MRRALLVFAACACVGPGIYDCEDDEDCGAGGRCEATGFCSFPDSLCGRRYGEHAAPEFRNRCVDEAFPDGPPGDGGLPDAPGGGCQKTCPGSCAGDVCTIQCGLTDPCITPVVCPAGLDCDILCGEAACPSGVDCGQAASCNVGCVGSGSCAGPIECGGSDCVITCAGAQSCGGFIDCFAEACVVNCNGDQSCGDDIVCGPGSCDVHCLANQTCLSGIDCSSSCACITLCSLDCGIVDCPIGCEDGVGDCTTLPPTCDGC